MIVSMLLILWFCKIPSSIGSFHITNSPFGVDYSLPIAGGLFCSSEATNVGECLFINRTTNCHYGRSIGVVCQGTFKYRVYNNL